MKKILLVFTAYLFIFSKCNKNVADETVTYTYLPSTVGSNWTYTKTTTSTTTVTYTVSSKDTTINSKTFKVLSGSDNSKQYYAKVSSDYYTLQMINGNTVEMNFLKDNKNAGDTWATSQTLTGLTGLPGGITSLTLNSNYTLQAKGTTRTVDAKTFSDVIKVRVDLSVTLPLIGSMSFGYAEYYFAKNIGIIEANIQIVNATAGINLTEVDKLQSYVIK